MIYQRLTLIENNKSLLKVSLNNDRSINSNNSWNRTNQEDHELNRVQQMIDKKSKWNYYVFIFMM